MRAVVQRVSSANVTIDHEVTANIAHGLLILLGIHKTDTPTDVEWLTTKIASLRIFADADDKMNRSLLDLKRTASADGTPRCDAESVSVVASAPPTSGSAPAVLVVSQFTLFASTRKGNRPSFNDAAAPDEAIPLYESFLLQLAKTLEGPVVSGTFGARMQVALVNDGPVTLILDSKLRE
ncbi:MAG TPA: D-aminoacyl-tRNA deacylase [Opitutus sp.]|nr:D-aminoacyl-tRNA deacylase [Opitutus sp.]